MMQQLLICSNYQPAPSSISNNNDENEDTVAESLNNNDSNSLNSGMRLNLDNKENRHPSFGSQSQIHRVAPLQVSFETPLKTN
jgi:hypothetical protein